MRTTVKQLIDKLKEYPEDTVVALFNDEWGEYWWDDITLEDTEVYDINHITEPDGKTYRYEKINVAKGVVIK